MPDPSPKSDSKPRSRNVTLIAAALLLAALALVVLYTSRRAFMSPMALVVIAAIGVAALLLQLRLRPDFSSAAPSRRPLVLGAFGVISAIAAILADLFHMGATLILMAALAAVVSFAAIGIIVTGALRKHRV